MRTISHVIDDKTEAAFVALASELKIPEKDFFEMLGNRFFHFDELLEDPSPIPNFYVYPDVATAAAGAMRLLKDSPSETIHMWFMEEGVEYSAEFDSAGNEVETEKEGSK